MPEPTLHWQGAAELRSDGAVWVGSLYLLGDVLYFVDGGRTDKRVRPHAALFALAGVLSTAPLTIEAYVFLWVEGGKTGADTIAQVVTALITVLLVVAGIYSRNKMEADDAAAMKALADMDEVPPVALLEDWCVEDGGSFLVPVSDVEECTKTEGSGLLVVTRLLERYELTVQPARDRLFSLLRP